ncbi:MAG: hypothetical protein V3S16_15700 [Candidatus Desulfatibia sp.]|uniref:hypothetical protein n=1 Tax=Candidatus Desulfatibia sp. TaxID=3101189 RepID=UPI002F31FC8E
MANIVSDKDTGLGVGVRINVLARGELLAVGGLEIQAQVLEGHPLSAVPPLPVGTCAVVYGKGRSVKQ